MIVTSKVALRIAALILVLTILQTAFFSQIELLGTSVWILPAVVTIFGLLGGSMIGASVGFTIGFLADALVDGPLGTSCLIFLAIGYLAGIYRERGDDAGRELTAVFCGLATLGANLGMGVFALILGLDAPLSFSLLPDVGIQAIYGFLMAFPLYWLIRRVLRPALIDDRSTRRRRRPKAIGI